MIIIKKPIIGIAYRSMKDENKIDVNFAVEGIRKAVIYAGGIPFLILDVVEDNDLKCILDICDGFVLPGGDGWYLADEFIVNYALEYDKPLLGICLGMQVLGKMLSSDKNSFGDTTVENNTSIEHMQEGNDFVHSIIIRENTKLFNIIGKSSIEVNSRHNFHINEIDSKYINSFSTDGIVEGIEVPNKKFIMGLQWHPESLIYKNNNSFKIFEAFISSIVG